MQRAALASPSLPILFRKQDEYLTSSVCPERCEDDEGSAAAAAATAAQTNKKGTPNVVVGTAPEHARSPVPAARLTSVYRSATSRPVHGVKRCTTCRHLFSRDRAGAANIRFAGMHELAFGYGPFRPRPKKAVGAAAAGTAPAS
jgi:hypothetical protein